MDVEDGGDESSSSHAGGGGNNQKPTNSGGYHLLHPHQIKTHPLVVPSKTMLISISLLLITAALASVLVYHSAHRIRYFFPSSFSPFSRNRTFHGFTKGNQSSTAIDSKPAKENHESASSNFPVPAGTTNASQQNPSAPPAKNNEEEEAAKSLKIVLKKAAMMNKTVIITTLNEAWTAPNSIFDLFLESFKIGNGTQGLLKHVVVIAFDQKAYARCLELHPHCHAVTTAGVDFSGEAQFMSADYLKMMWRRILFLHTVLKMGYNFIFTDADVMWFRDPFLHFYSSADFQIACDYYGHSSTDLNNAPNGGFNYVKSNEKTIKFYKFWYDSKDSYPGKHDQDVLNMIKYDPFIAKIGLKIRFLDTAFYGGFCQPSKDLDLVCTMHANCCIGLENKIHDLKMLIQDWKKYTALPSSETTGTITQTWTVPRICG